MTNNNLRYTTKRDNPMPVAPIWPCVEPSRRRMRVTVDACDARTITVGGKRYLNFSSNNYLGLAQHPEVLEAFTTTTNAFGSSASASPLVTGYQQPHDYLRAQICEWLDRDDVLLFSSGFAANQSALKSLLPYHDHVALDRLAHASMIDALMAKRSDKQSWRRFAHNDPSNLNESNQAEPRLLVTEGIFSMDGDSGLSTIEQMHERYLLYVDDAHAIGVCGEDGRGVGGSFSQAQVPYLMATFGKALGSAGAFVAGSHALIEHLLHHARDYIYSTAMPAAQAAATSAAITILQRAEGDSLRRRLADNITQFKERAAKLPHSHLASDSAIQGLVMGADEAAMSASAKLKELGFWCVAMRPPTVAQGSARLRITLSAAHSSADIEALSNALEHL